MVVSDSKLEFGLGSLMIWSYYNSRQDQSTMGIDPMNNISNNNKNTLCSYIISTSIDETIPINISRTPNIVENIFVGVDCPLEEIQIYTELFK